MKRNANAARTGSPARGLEPQLPTQEITTISDPEVPLEDVLKALRRLNVYVKGSKYPGVGSKGSGPLVRAIISLLKARGSDSTVTYLALETVTAMCGQLKGVASVFRLEGGFPVITQAVIRQTEGRGMSKSGFVCLSALCQTAQNSTSIVKAGIIQIVVQVLGDNATSEQAMNVESTDRAMCGINLLKCLGSSSDLILPYLGTTSVLRCVVGNLQARMSHRKFVTNVVDLFRVIFRRLQPSSDLPFGSQQRFLENFRTAGGGGVLFMTVARYGDSEDMLNWCYDILLRMQKGVLSGSMMPSQPQGALNLEFFKAKGDGQQMGSEGPLNVGLSFPENAESPLLVGSEHGWLDRGHAEGRRRNRALPDAISGSGKILLEGGVSSACAIAEGDVTVQQPFVPADAVTMSEIKIRRIERWLGSGTSLHRPVYVANSPKLTPEEAASLSLFDNANLTVFGERLRTSVGPVGVSGAAPVPRARRPSCAAGGEENFLPGGSWSAGMPRVTRSARSTKMQVDTEADISGGEDDDDEVIDVDGEDEEEAYCEGGVGVEEGEEGGEGEEGEEGDDVGEEEDEGEIEEGADDDAEANLVAGVGILSLENIAAVSAEASEEGETEGVSSQHPTALGSTGSPTPDEGLTGDEVDNAKGVSGGQDQLLADLRAQDSASDKKQRLKEILKRIQRGADNIPPANMHEYPENVKGLRTGETASDDVNAVTLLFESNFEGGNLGRAVQVTPFEYDLYLMPDTNVKNAVYSGGNTQWYYFAVTNMRAGVEYTLNIVNLVKSDSLYRQGMQPALFSTKDYQTTGAGWKRAGNRIAYIENTLETEGGSSYYSLTFTLQFPHDSDVCYLSHCIPYTYTDLSVFLAELTSNHASIVQMSTLCTTLCGNKCPLITVTNFSSPVAEIAQRRSIVVSSRVHPGETCASWAVQGFLEYLCGQTPRARILRDNFVFKVVPMLNPDGVIEGNYRCSMAGSDLNRQWSNPDPILHPTVSALKNLLKLCKSQRGVSVYCDMHGHSRKSNMFMYGCTSKSTAMRLKERIFPYLLHTDSLLFSYDDCNFKVQKCKESTARVVVWREFSIPNSYTLEMSLGGGDFGGEDPSACVHYSVDDYMRMGHAFCEGIIDMYDPSRVRLDTALRELELLHPEVRRSGPIDDAAGGDNYLMGAASAARSAERALKRSASSKSGGSSNSTSSSSSSAKTGGRASSGGASSSTSQKGSGAVTKKKLLSSLGSKACTK